MQANLAQVVTDPILNGLTQAGILGVIIAILFWRDIRKDAKLEQIVESINENANKTTDAINHLSRALLLEVLTRKDAADRAREEAREIQEAVSKKTAP